MGNGEWGMGNGEWGMGKLYFYFPLLTFTDMISVQPEMILQARFPVIDTADLMFMRYSN
ncbi:MULTISPECIES: hypothetical protein [unclassified Tolypothrix]|uniref:hypothetical protein n=1 Tax=unclassified Tolypothrix TaxID=2649714 RepID=UPI001439D0E6|nr:MULTISPECIES: hypothetical protein [unclassified Tolypothrix]UYD30259.1 hypothetical protein HGR01_17995 [Tolypothrix sp. PCC 7712]UYD38100.1 hypothetical protein HG267_00285 [Tolypothrix sp. PCC 7601]